jgi:hypothetical protein
LALTKSRTLRSSYKHVPYSSITMYTRQYASRLQMVKKMLTTRASHCEPFVKSNRSIHCQARDDIEAISTLAPQDAYQDATDATLPTKAMIDVICDALIGPLLRHVRASPIRRGASQYSKILGFAS